MPLTEEVYFKGTKKGLNRASDSDDTKLAVPSGVDHALLDIRYTYPFYYSITGAADEWYVIDPSYKNEATINIPAGTSHLYFRKAIENRVYFHNIDLATRAALGTSAQDSDIVAMVRVQFVRYA